MGFDPELTKQLLGNVGPLRHNPKVIKVCQQCHTNHIVRYRGAGKTGAPYFCRKCVVNRQEVRQKLSESTTKQWLNPEFAEQVRASSRAIWTDQSRRQRMSKIHHDEKAIKATINRNKTRVYDSQKISDQMKELWKDQEYRENMLAHIHKNRKSTAEVVAALIEINGDRFDYSETDYIDSHTKFMVKCNTCQHSHYTLIHNHIRNAYCCYCQVSNGQREIIDFVRQFDSSVVVNDRETIKPLELDIYLPQRRLAIEYHGLYFHSYDHHPTTEQKTKHQHKALVCRDKGIRLLQFFSNEWNDKVKAKLRYHFKGTIRVGARQCTITNNALSSFFADNHIQGHRNAGVTFALAYDNEIVAAMSFSRHHKYEWEIMRYACKLGVAVNGGASRLFKAFLDSHNPSTVVTYADLRYSIGEIYQRLGFEYLGHTKPNYFYTDRLAVYSRQSHQKHKLAKKLPKFDATKSEVENCLANGLRILYDAGHTKWLWTSRQLHQVKDSPV